MSEEAKIVLAMVLVTLSCILNIASMWLQRRTIERDRANAQQRKESQ